MASVLRSGTDVGDMQQAATETARADAGGQGSMTSSACHKSEAKRRPITNGRRLWLMVGFWGGLPSHKAHINKEGLSDQ